MTIRIGYIGSAHSIAKNKQLATHIQGITLVPYEYEYPYDVSPLYQQAMRETDVICFSGILPYFYRDASLDSNTPVRVARFHEYMVVTSLLTCIVKNNVTLEEISIDLPSAHLLKSIEKTIGYSFQKNLTFDYEWIYHTLDSRPFPFTEMVQFHKKLYTSGKTRMAVTSIHYIYDQLKALHIPVIYMNDYDDDLLQLLKNAKQDVLQQHMNESMIATLFITKKHGITAEDDAFIQSLLQTAVPLHDEDNKIDVAQYSTTRGVLSKHILQQIPHWMEHLEQHFGTTFSFGIGYGRQLYDAMQNATDALQIATQENHSNGYIVNEHNKRIGPLIGQTQIQNLRLTEDWLDKILAGSQTNMKTMQRFIQFMYMHNFQDFTTQELSAYSNVTVRTIERFIKKILDAEMIESHGVEQHVQQGRPRTVYKLTAEMEKQFRSYIHKNMISPDQQPESMT